jgi:TolB-like protein
VLPFENMSGDQECFANGIVEEITNALAFQVVVRDSSQFELYVQRRPSMSAGMPGT